MSAAEWIKHEIREVGAATLYFLIGLILILVLFKLLLVSTRSSWLRYPKRLSEH